MLHPEVVNRVNAQRRRATPQKLSLVTELSLNCFWFCSHLCLLLVFVLKKPC